MSIRMQQRLTNIVKSYFNITFKHNVKRNILSFDFENYVQSTSGILCSCLL
jgi:hypothetical protein